MASLGKTFTSSLGRKYVMGLTGILLVLFLVEHLVSNFLLITDPSGLKYNYFAHFMGHNPVIRILEIGLFALFIFHIVDGIILVAKNKKARPQGYAVKKKHEKVSLASQIMGPLGILILIFLILHLANFFAKAKILEVEPGVITWLTDAQGNYILDEDGHKIRDLSAVVYKEFKMPLYAIFYIVMMIPLGFHLYHGFQSAFQSMGWNHPKYTPVVKGVGVVLSIILSLGFAFIPFYIWLIM